MQEQAARLRARAGSWRTLASVLVILGIICAVLYGREVAEVASYFGDFDGQVFAIAAGASLLAIMVVLWPYFMIVRLMEGIADLMDGKPGSVGAPAPPPVSASAPVEAAGLISGKISELRSRFKSEGVAFTVEEQAGEVATVKVVWSSALGDNSRRYRLRVRDGVVVTEEL